MNFLSKGTRLKKKYKIINYVAKSKLSNVYLAKNEKMEKVIIKECFPEEIVIRNGRYVFTNKYKKDFENFKKNFFKEKCILEKFLKKSKKWKTENENGIIKIIDFFNESGTSYIVTEYFCGITLKEYILENRIGKKRLEVNEILKIFFKIADLVCQIHKKNIIHCDLKPSNILIDVRGNIKIIDFGTSVEKGGKIEFIKVSEGYSPIEIYSEKIKIDERSDVYSLMAILYFMFCEKKVDGVIERFYKPELEFEREVILGFEKIEKFKKMEEVIKKGLEYEREKRFGSVKEMVEEIKKFEIKILKNCK